MFHVSVFSCVGSGLATGRSPIQGVIPDVYKESLGKPEDGNPWFIVKG
jgi:hypothetical protein